MDLVSNKHSHKTQHFQRLRVWLKRGVIALCLLIISCAASVLLIDRWISWQTDQQIINSIDDVQGVEVAVILGTSKYLGKTLNHYYHHRIDAAIELYRQNKITHFLLSGDNAHRSYNEPWTMKRDLLRAEIPESSIHLDYAGFRTLDSIVRAKKIFDTNNFIIVTQRFHCERALFIANYHNIQAQCLAVPGPATGAYKVRLREVFARTKAVLDLYIMNTQPRFLGPKEPIVTHSQNEAEESLSQN
ncbi:SanA/YdcF family protein [Vibrio hippocampi]|uniref:DUF218 domain-containing protein n=1 Tax=Vibrio hippocampi TaxID=654686 RepID=A0ABN8DFH6_9VIBR|nr:ElyC/SanA/YdcF family protein [Vibrio hippocampi]CAH0525814.1 hypothetical protein VHP8226_01345 [Vibrio hippocampi]